MVGTATRALQLRSIKTVRDPKTGELLKKPTPPGMRVMEKGAWTYREVVSPESEADVKGTEHD